MTLVSISQVELAQGSALLVTTDSMLSGGYRWPRGPKLFGLGASCVLAYEGNTDVAYPLLINASNFITFSDHLLKSDAEPEALFERVRMDMTNVYAQLLDDKSFEPGDSRCSFLLAGWSRRRGIPIVQHLEMPAPPKAEWSVTDVTSLPDWKMLKCFFAGNGDSDPVGKAWTDVKNSAPGSRFAAHAAFLNRIRDSNETSVGGCPQVALVGLGTRQILGMRDKTGNRFLLGHAVLSGASGVSYYDFELEELR